VVLVLHLQTSSADDRARSPTPKGTTSASTQVRLPTATGLEAGESFAAERAGRVSFAVVDTSGTLAYYRCRLSFHSASVIKAMLLVAYLNHLASTGERLPADHEAHLASMIRVSDNEAATATYAHFGDEGLAELAAEAQMTAFRVSGSWGSAHITAADQARFFAAFDDVTAPNTATTPARCSPRSHPSSLGASPRSHDPEWQTFFKGGWLTHGDGSLVHQVARLEQAERTMAIAVLTDVKSQRRVRARDDYWHHGAPSELRQGRRARTGTPPGRPGPKRARCR
jgi:hypothetical protein